MKALRAKIKKLEEKRDEALEVLKKVPDVRAGVYAATFAGLTYGYYYGLVDILPKFLFQFGFSGTREEMEKQAEDKLLLYILGGPSVVILDQMGVDVEGILRAGAPLDMGITIFKELGIIKKEEEEAFTAKKVHDPSGAIEAAARKEAADQGVPYVPPADDVNIQDAQKKKALWAQLNYRLMIGNVMVAMGMAGATMLFLMETSTSEVANVGAKLLDAVTPLT